jgi:Spy/CpxP family protein refolding chaperone
MMYEARISRMKTWTGKLIPAAAALLLLLSLPFFASAQEDEAQQNQARTTEQGQNNQDADLIRRLQLTPDQIRQIRQIRRENGEEMRLSRQALIQAQRALDEAIYADTPSETEVEKRAHEVSAAQATVLRLRALTELRIRRVLTPEQLDTLRKLRAEALEQNRERRRERREENAFQNNQRQNQPGEKKQPRLIQQPPAGARGRRP